MPLNSNKQMHADLGAILEGLITANVKFILVGGLAAVIQGAPMTTLDVDIVHDRSAENIARLLDFLTSVDAVFRQPDDKIIRPKSEDISQFVHALLSTRLGPLDVLAMIEEGKTYSDLIDHTVQIEFRGHTLHVLDLETLIRLKKASKNPKHRQQLPVLEEALRQIKKRQD